MTSEMFKKSLSEIASLIKSKDVSPVELTRGMLDRIESLDCSLHSYLTVTADLAIKQAQKAESEIVKGKYRGTMHGVPIAVKDLIYTKDALTTCASTILKDWVPDHDATVMTKLYDAGAVLLGKLSLTEFAGIGYHPTVPMPTNPWNTDYWAGSSSSGSAVATSASLCFGSLGTDTGGSLRFPASACGVIGLKPTYGRVSRYGVFPLAESLDHVGLMTRSVSDAALMLEVIAGFDPKDAVTLFDPVPDYCAALSAGIKGVKIGMDQSFCTEGMDSELSAAILSAADVLSSLGAEVRDVKFTHIQEAVDAWGVIFTSECGLSHEATFPSRAEEYSAAFRAFLEVAPNIRGIDYARAHVGRRLVCRTFENLFNEVDLLLLPTMPFAAMALEGRPVDEVVTPEVGNALLRCTSPFSLTGNPSISLPCGFSSKDLPFGLQLVGRHAEETTLLKAAYSYEEASDWLGRYPLDSN